MKITNLFHALRRGTGESPEKPDPRQTDSAETCSSGDSRERPAFDFRRDVFDWRMVPPVDPQEVENWRGRTDAVELQFPLQLALQVHDELEQELMQPGKLDALRLSEIRGGIKALARFAQTYNTALYEPKKPDEGDLAE